MREARRNDTTGTFDADKWVTDNLPNLIRTQIPGSGMVGVQSQKRRYTRRSVVKMIQTLSSDGSNPERLEYFEDLLERVDQLMATPGFDQTKLPGWVQ